MSIGKRIAFIGDSYSDYYYKKGSGKFHWSFLLSKQYPQHTFYTYGKSGMGIDYFKLCIYDCIENNIDAIFLAPSFNGRRLILVDSIEPDSKNNYKFIEEKISSNYSFRGLNIMNTVWASSGSGKFAYTIYKSLAENFAKFSASSNISIQQENKWYNIVDKIYNFEKVWVLDTKSSGPYVYKHSNLSIVETFYKVMNINPHDKDVYKKLVDKRLVISNEDDHWTPSAHRLVLNHYILNDDVKNYLTQS